MRNWTTSPHCCDNRVRNPSGSRRKERRICPGNFPLGPGGRVLRRSCAVASISPARDSPSQGDHFQRGGGGSFSGVTVLAAATIPRLLLVVGRQHAEDDRQFFRKRDI